MRTFLGTLKTLEYEKQPLIRTILRSVSTSFHVLGKLSVSSQTAFFTDRIEIFFKILGTALRNGARRLVPQQRPVTNDQLGVTMKNFNIFTSLKLVIIVAFKLYSHSLKASPKGI